MIEFVLNKLEEIVSNTEFGVLISYEHDGAYSAKMKIRANGQEFSLGKLIFDPEYQVFIYKKTDKGSDNTFFLNWAVISKLRLCDKIEIAQPTDKKTEIDKCSISVRKLCEKADFVNLQNKGLGLQILLKKENTKCEKMKFNINTKKYEVMKRENY